MNVSCTWANGASTHASKPGVPTTVAVTGVTSCNRTDTPVEQVL